MANYVHPELLASTEWLAEHLDDPAVRIVDLRYYFDGRDGHAIYLQGHLPGAVTRATRPIWVIQPRHRRI